ncbi:hypothetical protein HELRODRAFT_162959 [Helobdella robusta]|uniref:Uncharacterized protein n=1 Tax=Helobdella robusta TaxID=6412 RepID=T1ETF5_HELRO|nr:hypothetical protein HELRODRAFT_162959 [Helobdella robusta]ESN99412.1 hypothetical protein HELRODRAFT_162959 [Helobdella robusta]
MAKTFSVEPFENIVTKILDKSNENLVRVIALSDGNLEKIFEKFDSSLTTVIERSNEDLRKSLAHSEGLMSKLFESTLLRMEALGNSFERAVRSMSDAVTDSMNQLHTAMSTLGTNIAQCQIQILKINETPMIEQMTKTL